jgi:hypothetical protein
MLDDMFVFVTTAIMFILFDIDPDIFLSQSQVSAHSHTHLHMHPDAALMLSQHGGIPGYPGETLFRLGHVSRQFSPI